MDFKISPDDKTFLNDVLEYLEDQQEPIFCSFDKNKRVKSLILPGIIDDILEKRDDLKRFERLFINHCNENN